MGSVWAQELIPARPGRSESPYLVRFQTTQHRTHTERSFPVELGQTVWYGSGPVPLEGCNRVICNGSFFFTFCGVLWHPCCYRRRRNSQIVKSAGKNYFEGRYARGVWSTRDISLAILAVVCRFAVRLEYLVFPAKAAHPGTAESRFAASHIRRHIPRVDHTN